MAVVEVEKKVDAKARHEEAIARFQAWLKYNPESSLKRQIKQFDRFMDAAYFRSRLQ